VKQNREDKDYAEIIAIRNVSLMRGGKEILQDISWTMRRGEHWFIMGNNGSGKTTMMEVIMGYLWPQKGSVDVLGNRFGQVYLQDLRRRIGYVSPWIFKHLGDHVPVVDVIASGMDASVGFYSELSPALHEKIRAQLDFFHCTDLIDRRFGTLSSGQQLKVVLARSLINEPDIMILDEPFSLLDIGSRLSMYRYIKKLCLNGKGPQLLLVTHHLDDVISPFSHGLLMKEGRIFYQGRRDAVLQAKRLARAFDLDENVL
jgi:iron complex transport system ATP-binding protein